MPKIMRWASRRARRESRSERGDVLVALAALGYIPPHVGPVASVWDRYGVTIAACIGGAVLLILPTLLGARRCDEREADQGRDD
jgi:hypothetical protein